MVVAGYAKNVMEDIRVARMEKPTCRVRRRGGPQLAEHTDIALYGCV